MVTDARSDMDSGIGEDKAWVTAKLRRFSIFAPVNEIEEANSLTPYLWATGFHGNTFKLGEFKVEHVVTRNYAFLRLMLGHKEINLFTSELHKLAGFYEDN